MPGTLFLVATPIGNLGDMSERAIETLKSVDFIAAEDTRVSLKLLNHFDFKKPLVSYYEHNRLESGEKILRRLELGESCALVTDAGTPAISDPGEDIVRQCAAAGIEVIPVPGACAAICALAVSALPTQRFCFEGFLSVTRKNRIEHLESLVNEPRTMIFYEAPHKLVATLRDMLNYFGDRQISISRELTKLHEQTQRTTIAKALEYYEQNPPRGEFVLVVAGAAPEEAPEMTLEQALEKVSALRDAGSSLKQAVKAVAEQSGFSRNELYDAAIK